MTHRNVAPPRRRPKRVLVVRMLVAKLAWLEGSPRWREGRVVWEGPDSRCAPDVADLALAQRTLTRLGSYPFAAREALGDSEGWLRERRARLELAKHLRALATPDPSSLARRALAGDADSIERVAALLTAEALCLNLLPTAPSAVLVNVGGRAEAALRALLEQPVVPREGRALAALMLGALHRAGGHPPMRTAGDDAWVRRAYQWGRRAGLPAEPALAVTLLSDERGLELADRHARLQSAPGRVRLEPALLRELLAEGVPPAQVVELAEAAREADALAEGLLRRRRELPDRASLQRRAIAAQLAEQRQEAVAAFCELLNRYARAGRQPEALRLIAQFGRRMLGLGRVTPDLVEAILVPLRRGLDLPVPLLLPWLRLLVERHEELWDLSTLPTSEKDTRRGKPRLGVWLDQKWALTSGRRWRCCCGRASHRSSTRRWTGGSTGRWHGMSGRTRSGTGWR